MRLVQWASTISTLMKFDSALDEAAADLTGKLAGGAPDVVAVFVSPHHRADFLRVPRALHERFPTAVILGCSGGGVIGNGREVEQAPGVSLTAAELPGVDVLPFHFDDETMPGESAEEWGERLGVAPDEHPHIVMLPDPFTCDVARLIDAFDHAYPESVKLGGLASGGNQPGHNALFIGDDVQASGVAGIALRGNIEVDTIVAQGCRPIGNPMFATRCEHNVIHELDGRLPAHVLQDLFERLSQKDRRLFRHSLFLGVVMSSSQEIYRQGDFLIRNIVGLDTHTGAMAIAGAPEDNAVVQFHLRDAETSAHDLNCMLEDYSGEGSHPNPAGALMFSCVGRGRFLYGSPDHDSQAFRRHLGSVPLGGFFCNGEIGPIHGKTFLHGYTSSFGLFRRSHAN